MTLSELIAAYGDDKVQAQHLDQCAERLNMNGGVTKITFGTEQPLTLDGTSKLGIVIWLDRDRVAEIIKQGTSPAPAGEPVGIKALEWRQSKLSDSLVATHPFGENYVVTFRDDAYRTIGKNYTSLKAAQAAAQADYETRIRSALHPTPTPVGVVEYRLLDSADTIQADDEFIGDDGVSWESPSGWAIGARYSHLFKSGRRALRSPAVEGK